MIRRPGTHCESTRSRHGGLWCALLAAAFVLPWLAGCEKGPPKFQDLIGQGEEKKEEPKAAPPVAPQASPTPVKPKPATPPAPKKRTPQEVLGDFNRTQSQDRTDGLLAELAQVEDGVDQVTRIDVSRSKVTDAGLRHIEKLDSVTSLNLGAVGFTNPGLESVAKMKNVEDLSLDSTPIGAQAASNDPNVRFLDSGLARLTKMPKLRVLRLNRAKISEKGLDEIAKMTDLEGLYLSGTSVSDENVEQLKGLKNLRALDLSETRITDKCFASLMELDELEWLDVGRNKDRINGTGMFEARKRKGLAKLKHLSVADTKWGDPGMEAIMKTNTLEYLDLGDTNVNDINLEAVKSLKNLQIIYLHRLSRFTSNGLAHLKGLKELRTVFLERSRGVGDPGLAHLKGLKKLERLVLWETSCTEKGAGALKKALPDLSIELKRGSPAL